MERCSLRGVGKKVAAFVSVLRYSFDFVLERGFYKDKILANR